MAKKLYTVASIQDAADAIREKNGSNTLYTVAQFGAAIRAIPSKEDVEWHQCPEAVRNFLSNVDYTGVAYTLSSVSNYAPSTPVPATNTKPNGTTVDGVTFYNEVPGIKTPFATANKAGTLEPLNQVRWINTAATQNFRDLGGWACDGGTVKYGLLYRSGNPGAADEELITRTLGIHTEIDLTADGVPAYGDRMRYICAPTYAMYSLADTSAWTINLEAIFEAVRYGDPCLFHCSMGADRTGTLACVLLGLLGVSQSDIDKDYELTSFYSLRARNGNYQGGTSDWAHLMAAITALSGDTFRDKCVRFVYSLGFTIDEINAYRHAMIDGTPEDVEAPITMVELFDPSTATLNLRFNSSGVPSSAATGNFCTDFIPVSGLDTSEPYRIHIREVGNNSMFRPSDTYNQIAFFKSDKTIMNTNYGRLTINTNTSGTNTLCKHDDSSGGVYIDINQTGDGNYIPSSFFNLAQVAYIRLCMHYSSSALTSTDQLANVSITADKITA